MSSRFVPDNFSPRQVDIDWAIQEYNITAEEVRRQFGLMYDHEFKRSYSDWNRVFRNWMRKADEIQTLKREHKYRTVEPLLPKQKEADILAFHKQIEKFGK
jgi:hypothetical protein